MLELKLSNDELMELIKNEKPLYSTQVGNDFAGIFRKKFKSPFYREEYVLIDISVMVVGGKVVDYFWKEVPEYETN